MNSFMRLKKYTAVLLSVLLILAPACNTIENNNERENEKKASSARTKPDYEYNDHETLSYPITVKPFSEKRQLEDLTSHEVYSSIDGFEGNGYILLEDGQTAAFEINVPSSQHYAIGLKIRSDNAVIALFVNDKQEGVYYAKSPAQFSEVRLHGIYLEQGVNQIKLSQLKGVSYLDFITVTDFVFPEARFNAYKVPANQNASPEVRFLMDYLGETFGKKTLLAQHVTPGTNTELNAIYEATGRLPAIRVSDLMKYSRSYEGADVPAGGIFTGGDDIALALEWAETGGLVSYDWTWFSPSLDGGRSHYYAGESDINLNSAFTSSVIADLDAERLLSLYEAGGITETCYELVLEIDYMAENLKRLRDADVPVLWRPMHQAATRWFWWGNCQPEAYKWLWRLMFERFSDYHGLDNIIWVWAGQNPEYYPGDEYVDIIGEDIYNMSDVSNIPAFFKTGDYSKRGKLTAMTECGLLPSPDLLSRDSAVWLWTALYRGDYLIGNKGTADNLYNYNERLERIYNHELTITLDKLPEEY
ncbi:MAG: hypothetical protein FWG44_02350 [Oscillospiraceae bacterium]|nr:hypothetical protein [Oscillospiraceae bacterium]